MNYTHPQIRRIAQRIPILCASYFAVFSFFYLYVFERDILAQTQFRLSEGTTVYHPFLAAFLCTLLLTFLGLFIGRLFHWLPLRLKASAWFLPFLLVGALTHWRYPEYGDTGTAPGWGTVALLLSAYVLWLFISRLWTDSSKERESSFAYAWPNGLQLIAFTVMCVCLSNTNIMLHRTLYAARQLSEGRYDQVLQAAQWEQHPSRQLSAMTALALSENNLLGEYLFAYPQPHGSEGLLPTMSDTLMCYDLPRAAGYHLGYKRGQCTSSTFFLKVIANMPKAQPAVRDYLLCAYLLDRNLEAFTAELGADAQEPDSLPRHYGEALVLYRHTQTESLSEELVTPLDSCFHLFQELLHEKGTQAEREFNLRHRFGASYWTYYYFN